MKKRGWEDRKSQRTRKFSVRLHLLAITKATPMISPRRPKHELKKETIDMLKWVEENAQDLKPTQRTSGN